MFVPAPTNRPRRSVAGFALAVGVLLMAATAGPSARAFSTGKTGSTGNPATGGSTCALCHSGGPGAAQMTVSGPTQVSAGSTVVYQVAIAAADGEAAGFAASVGDAVGSLDTGDSLAQVDGSEVTHSAPRPFDGGVTTFEFTWTAPAAATETTIYVAGVAANLDSTNSGDDVATSHLDVTVTGPEPSPTPTADALVFIDTAGTSTAPAVESTSPAESIAAISAASTGAFGFGLNPVAAEPASDSDPASTDQAGGQVGAELANTGVDSAGFATLAMGALIGGTGLVVLQRRSYRRGAASL